MKPKRAAMRVTRIGHSGSEEAAPQTHEDNMTAIATDTTTPRKGAPAGFTKRADGDLMDAHRQWASRSPDEAVFTVDDLIARTERVRADSRELEGLDWSKLEVAADAKTDNLVLCSGRDAAAFTNYSLKQFCNLPSWGGEDDIGSGTIAPHGFLTKLSGPVAANVLNDRLRAGVRRKSDASALLSGHNLRSITTEAYERVWDHDLALRVADLCDKGTWQPAEAFKRAGNQAVKHAWGETSALPLGWVGDRSMFVCLVDYEGAVEHNGNQYARFFLLSNSEVGAGSLKVTFGLMDFACSNFILWGCHEVYEANFRHTGSIHDRWADLSAGMNRSLAADNRRQIVAGIESASGLLLGEDRETAIAVARATTQLPATVINQAYDRAEATPRYGDPRSVWGMLNGITETSQHVTTHADKRTLIDTRAAKLMSFVA